MSAESGLYSRIIQGIFGPGTERIKEYVGEPRLKQMIIETVGDDIEDLLKEIAADYDHPWSPKEDAETSTHRRGILLRVQRMLHRE